jgi:hypothetical protein
MADTPITGETANQGQSQTTVSNTDASSSTNNTVADNLAKELEQARMRNNQLANDLEKAQKAEADRQKKQLEDKEEFKTLYEQTQSKLDELESSRRANEQKTALAQASEELFKDYDANVIDIAKTTNLSLSEDTDEARNALKEKLDAIKAKVAPSTNNKVTSNNQSNPVQGTINRSDLTARAADGSSPMAIAGAKGDDSVVLSYIHELPAIKRMREIANNGN